MIDEMIICPFCGNVPDLTDEDTLYPMGVIWYFNDELQCRIYDKFSMRYKYKSYGWCYILNCHNCGCSISADSKEECIDAWNRRIK